MNVGQPKLEKSEPSFAFKNDGMFRRFLGLVVVVCISSLLLGCGDADSNSNEVDDDVPTDEVTGGEPVDPSELLNGTGDSEAQDNESESPSSDSNSTGADDSSDATSDLKMPELNQPSTGPPKLDPLKLEDPTKKDES